MANPFTIFPEEIWEDILGRLSEHSESDDMLNTLEAINELKHLASGKQCTWLIGAVMPHLFPKHLSVEDMKTCRIVSRWWKNTLDKILESHHDRLPYKSKNATDNTELHFNYSKLPHITTNFGLFCGTLSGGFEGIYDRMLENPFPGRHVHVTARGFGEENPTPHLFHHPTCHPAIDLTTMALPLHLFGHHIWHITFQIPFGRREFDDRGIMRPLKDRVISALEPFFRCLNFSPDLKSIKLEGSLPLFGGTYPWTSQEKLELGEFIRSHLFPFRLDTIDVCGLEFVKGEEDVHGHILQALVTHENVQKLVVHARLWNATVSDLFPNLSELCLGEVEEMDVQSILANVPNTPVRKLRILAKDLCTSELLQIVALCKLEALEVFGDVKAGSRPPKKPKSSPSLLRKIVTAFLPSRRKKCEVNVESTKEETEVSSIKSLTVGVYSNTTYDFIKPLSSLQHLTVQVIRLESRWVDWKQQDTFCRFLHDLNNGNRKKALDNLKVVWMDLPELKMITVYMGGYRFQYARECMDTCFVSEVV